MTASSSPRLPPLALPVIDTNGNMARAWYNYFERLDARMNAIGALADLPGGSVLATVVTRCNAITEAAKG